jgi:hypothetical protein
LAGPVLQPSVGNGVELGMPDKNIRGLLGTVRASVIEHSTKGDALHVK